VGAFTVYYLIEYQIQDDPTLSAVLTGILVVAVVRFAPGGLWALLRSGAQAARSAVQPSPRRA